MVERILPASLIEDNKYCPGCGHGVVNRLIAEVFDELQITGKVIGALPVGCACLMGDTLGIDWVQSAHGRAAAVASGIKRCRPESPVFAYQGDGDSMSIGLSETLYAAVRNENITVILINNGIYGMTGGQMAPTTLPGQKTVTSPFGRDPELTGEPLNIISMMQQLSVGYLARGSVTSVAQIAKLKKYIRSAFENQMSGNGYAMVEVVSPCPTNWKMSPKASLAHINDEVTTYFPLGEYVAGKGGSHD